MDTASSELWKRFDQSLFELKLREPSRKMHEETESRWRKVQFERRKIGQGEGIGLFLALADSDLAALREFLEKDIDRICREVWRAQGNSVTADFVRAVLVRTVLNTMEVRIASVKWGIEEIAKRQRSSEDLFPVRTHLVQATDQLKSILGNRYEIEARELEYRNAPTEGLPRQKQVQISQPFDQRENLRDAIIKKKARVVEIERILNRPPLTEYHGRPVHGGQNWRLRLEEERQHLMLAVEELEAELARASSSLSVQTMEGKSTKAAPTPFNAVAEFGEVLAAGIGSRRRGWITAALGTNAVPAGNRREAFIKPILEKKGLSIRQWAINAKVDFHTADDYLKGKTKPYPDTLKKLADALGVEVAKLPL